VNDRPYNVLFLTTGNSVRSILAEAILNKVGAGKFRGYSAGSRAKGHVHPETLRLLASLGYDTTDLRSKSLDELLKGPQFNFVLTVCDDVASEAPPIWPGQPTTAHWGIADPAEAKGTPASLSTAEPANKHLRGPSTALPRPIEPPEQTARDRRDGGRYNAAGTFLMSSPNS
jgi:protein-tyrosine-phosphatase